MDKDKYWTIEKLLPHVQSSFRTKPNVGADIRTLTPEEKNPYSRFTNQYTLPGSRVIRRYSLCVEGGAFSFPALADTSDPPAYVSCDLFSPDYLSLLPEQRRYFSFFVRRAEQSIKVETCFSYLKLAVCYALSLFDNNNLPDLFFTLWSLYRGDFPAAEKLFCDVYCDWCFYRKRVPDYEKLSKMICRGVSVVRPFFYHLFIFDYLFTGGKKLNSEEEEFILRNITSLSFRKSRAYKTNKRYAALCEDALKRAMDEGIFNADDNNTCLFDLQIPAELRSIRPMFADLPQQYVPKAEICLVYYPFFNNDVIRERCDAVVRYVDNRIRSILRLKNQLGRVAITPVHKAFLERILQGYESYAPSETKSAPVLKEEPDPPRQLVFDPGLADEIEEESWKITKQLTEIYQDSGEMITLGNTNDESFDKRYSRELTNLEARVLHGTAESRENPFLEFASALSADEDSFVSVALYRGADAARSFAKVRGLFFDALVASCNGKAVETAGDSIFEPGGTVYEEYTSDLKDVFLSPSDQEN